MKWDMNVLHVYWSTQYGCAYWIDPITGETVFVHSTKLIFARHFLKKGYCKKVVFHYGRKNEYTKEDV